MSIIVPKNSNPILVNVNFLRISSLNFILIFNALSKEINPTESASPHPKPF